jgi:maltooligosyltrehalose synthase
MGLLLDIVPNHMCIAGDTTGAGWTCWRTAPARTTPASSTRLRPPKPELVGRVLLPVLPKQYGHGL